MSGIRGAMRQAVAELAVETRGKGLLDITGRVASWMEEQGIRDGLLTVFVRHTSASLTIQENADPSVLADLEAYLSVNVPEDPGAYRHRVGPVHHRIGSLVGEYRHRSSWTVGSAG